MTSVHESVFLKEAVEGLNVVPGDIIVDATIGGAGHYGALLQKLEHEGLLIGIDADPEAVERGKEIAGTSEGVRAEVVLGNFRDLDRILDELQVETISGALFDLGWSSYHLTSGRGFSFRVEEPLLMTYGTPEMGKTAADVVNSATEETLSDILHSLGEERFARQIARGIVRIRSKERILTTTALADAVIASTPEWYHGRRIHPATKTFQALRMYVNDELGALREGLQSAMKRLSVGGRIAVITFHSLEDRVVKTMFRDGAHGGFGTVITKKPIEPSITERTQNPRARSAKLRIFERLEGGTSSLTHFATYAYA